MREFEIVMKLYNILRSTIQNMIGVSFDRELISTCLNFSVQYFAAALFWGKSIIIERYIKFSAVGPKIRIIQME